MLVALLAVVAGCAKPHESGDLGQFLVMEVKAWGGKAVSLNGLPKLVGSWTYERHQGEAVTFENGTVIWSKDISFNQIDAFLRQLYGAPVRSGTTPENEQQWTMPAKVAGCSIWYSKHGDGVQVTVLKPFKL
jgi:hypothetical protein